MPPSSNASCTARDRLVEVGVAADHRDPDLGGGDHLDVDAGLGQRGEELGGDARVRAHAGADQRDLADVVVEQQRLEVDLGLHPVERGHRHAGRRPAGRVNEMSVRPLWCAPA